MATFTIGEPVNQVVLRDVIQIEVEFMHGDADATTFQCMNWEPAEAEQAYDIIRAWVDACEAASGYEEKYEPALKAICKAAGLSKAETDGYSNLLLQGDVTTDGQYYAPGVAVNVRYFDLAGVELEVTVS